MTAHSPAIFSKWDEDPRKLMDRAVAIALESCTCDPPFHVWWPILRAAGIFGANRGRDDDALSSVLRPLIADDARVLIAGSADTATLCTIGRISDPRKPDLTVLDCCPAPLKLIQEFAAERAISCRTLHADLISYSEESRWDIVIAHYTVQFIFGEDRFRVFERLARSLVPGGTLICVNKVVPGISATDASAVADAWYQKAWRKVRAEGLEAALPAPLYERLLRQAAEGRSRRAGLVLVGENLVGSTHAPAQAAETCVILAASRPR